MKKKYRIFLTRKDAGDTPIIWTTSIIFDSIKNIEKKSQKAVDEMVGKEEAKDLEIIIVSVYSK